MTNWYHSIFSLYYSMKLYRKNYRNKQNACYKGTAQEKVASLYDTPKPKQMTGIWWISRVWQRFHRSFANAPLPFTR